MPSWRVEITVDEDTLMRLDDARGFEPRASFIKRTLESVLSQSGTVASMPSTKPADGPVGRAAPSRTSDVVAEAFSRSDVVDVRVEAGSVVPAPSQEDEFVRENVIVEATSFGVVEGECPVGRCSQRGPVGHRCPLHPNMSFKVL